ncbi:Leucine-rich repeat serine/threonine-protein kinase 2 [Ceratobasidium sp. 395]|nr:Leucine-rich repeat serine/threonine-protein kinase 2 [Ceratobasidium sp. 395]
MRWAAPEILNGLQTRSKEGDVYALGMTLIEAITGVKPFGDLGDMAVWRAVMVEKLIPERPKIFPSFTLDEAEELWEVVVHACAHGAPDRPDSRTIQRRLQNIRRRVIHPSFNLSGVDPTPHVVVNSLAGGNGERGEKNEVHPPIIDETKNQLCHIDRLPDCGEYDDQQQPHAQSVLPPLSPSQTYDVQTDPRASTPRHQSTSVVLANSSWAPHQPWPAPQQAPYYTPEAYIGRHASTEPHPQLQTPPLLPPSRWDNYQPSPPQSDEESRPCSPELLSERRSAPEPGQAGSFAAHWPGPPYIPDPIGVMVDSRFDRSDVQITYTGDYAVKLGRHVLRHCFNCHATEPSGWRESTLTPGKIVRAVWSIARSATSAACMSAATPVHDPST